MGAAGWGSVFIPALEWGHSELGALSQFFGPLGRLRDQGVCSLEEAGEGRTGLGPQGEPSAGPPCRGSVPWLSALTTAPPAQKRKAPPGLGVLSEKICTEASRTVGHCHSIVNTAASAPSFHREPCEYPLPPGTVRIHPQALRSVGVRGGHFDSAFTQRRACLQSVRSQTLCHDLA